MESNKGLQLDLPIRQAFSILSGTELPSELLKLTNPWALSKIWWIIISPLSDLHILPFLNSLVFKIKNYSLIERSSDFDIHGNPGESCQLIQGMERQMWELHPQGSPGDAECGHPSSTSVPRVSAAVSALIELCFHLMTILNSEQPVPTSKGPAVHVLFGSLE